MDARYRPCARCVKSGKPECCVDVVPKRKRGEHAEYADNIAPYDESNMFAPVAPAVHSPGHAFGEVPNVSPTNRVVQPGPMYADALRHVNSMDNESPRHLRAKMVRVEDHISPRNTNVSPFSTSGTPQHAPYHPRLDYPAGVGGYVSPGFGMTPSECGPSPMVPFAYPGAVLTPSHSYHHGSPHHGAHVAQPPAMPYVPSPTWGVWQHQGMPPAIGSRPAYDDGSPRHFVQSLQLDLSDPKVHTFPLSLVFLCFHPVLHVSLCTGCQFVESYRSLCDSIEAVGDVRRDVCYILKASADITRVRGYSFIVVRGSCDIRRVTVLCLVLVCALQRLKHDLAMANAQLVQLRYAVTNSGYGMNTSPRQATSTGPVPIGNALQRGVGEVKVPVSLPATVPIVAPSTNVQTPSNPAGTGEFALSPQNPFSPRPPMLAIPEPPSDPSFVGAFGAPTLSAPPVSYHSGPLPPRESPSHALGGLVDGNSPRSLDINRVLGRSVPKPVKPARTPHPHREIVSIPLKDNDDGDSVAEALLAVAFSGDTATSNPISLSSAGHMDTNKWSPTGSVSSASVTDTKNSPECVDPVSTGCFEPSPRTTPTAMVRVSSFDHVQLRYWCWV